MIFLPNGIAQHDEGGWII